MFVLAAVLAFLVSCSGDISDESVTRCFDADGDGYYNAEGCPGSLGVDCIDFEATINPGTDPGCSSYVLDPPHIATKEQDIDCHICHPTNGESDAGLCLTCHEDNGIGWSEDEQAVPGTSGSSHRWDALVDNPSYFASLPLGSEMSARLVGGQRLMCSTCHNTHSQDNPPADPLSPASMGSEGRHFQRLDNSQDQMCFDCHRSLDVASVAFGAWNGKPLSHPVGVGLPLSPHYIRPPNDANGSAQVAAYYGTATGGNTTALVDSTRSWGDLAGLVVRFTSGANKNDTREIIFSSPTQINFSALQSRVMPRDGYEIDRDGNTTNNIILVNSGGPNFTEGNVICMSCHGVHNADSDADTYDGQDSGPGDGMLLRRGNGSRICTGCHNMKIHNSANNSNTYGVWGEDYTCLTCHDAHGSRNIYLVRESIGTPASSGKAVDFRNLSHEGSEEDYGLVDSANPGLGPCEVCHTKTRNEEDGSALFRNDGTGDGGLHYSSKCTNQFCHPHSMGFGIR